MESVIRATRYHDISCGHRVAGHESKCAHLHGHNYRIHFTIEAQSLDSLGRVLDFSAIKSALCEWLESNWDHRMLIWECDHLAKPLSEVDPIGVCIVEFNPTAENMAEYLLLAVGPAVLPRNITLTSVVVEETRKCSASAHLAKGGD